MYMCIAVGGSPTYNSDQINFNMQTTSQLLPSGAHAEATRTNLRGP